MSNKSLLEIHNLTKVFEPQEKGEESFTAVNDISFSMMEGEVLGLLGPNGAGKSTTIQMLLGVLKPTSGNITYFGKEFTKNRSEILQDVAFASTYIKMPWRLSLLENLRIYALLYGVSNADFMVRVEKFLKYFGVWDQRNKSMNNLSAGQMTRVMLAKAFIPYPKIVLLDEPTASLDPDIAHQVRDFVRMQQEKYNTTILYTSHNMDEVTDLCDRVVFLQKGTIVAIDTPEELAKSVSIARMRLQVRDGMKRTKEIAQKKGFEAVINNREIEVSLDEHKIADFLSILADKKIEYTQITIAKPTLEDYFLSMSTDEEVK